MRTQFTFYESFLDAINDLDDADQLTAYRAVATYALTGELPNISGAASAVFKLIRPILDKAAKKSENSKSQTNEDQTENKPTSNEDQTDIKPTSNDEQTDHEGEREREREIEIEKEIEIDNNPPIIPLSGADRDELVSFDDFWVRYPKKVAKKAAVMAWKKLKAEDRLRIIPALETQSKSSQWLRDGGQYVPNPATWLNGRRWEDEIDTSPPKTKGQLQFEADMDMIAAWGRKRKDDGT